MDYYGDFETWLHDVAEEKIFKVQKVRKIWTPEELENKYADEEEYEIVKANATLVEIIPLGGELNNAQDYLLGFRDNWVHTEIIDKEYKSCVKFDNYVDYYKLSEIILTDNTENWKEELKECGIE